MGTPVGTTDVPDETAQASGSAGRSRELVPGASLGKYRLDHVLGRGGMGVVWAAHDPDLERSVALKVLRYDNPAPELRRRLLREARAMARLKHPFVLTVYEVDSEGDRDFIAMELVDGASLDRWLADKPSRDEVWHAIVAAGHGLAAAHHAGIVHRDFKPHNVLRSRDGRVLVTDFGLARGHGDDAAGAIATEAAPAEPPSGLEATIDATPARAAGPALDAPLTVTGALIGTPAYMAPEQFLGAASDPRTDQFAYCVTAWQLLVGERPFRGSTIDELRRAASAGVAGMKVKLPGAIRAVLARGLEPDPSKRWPDMNALLAALERAKAVPARRRRLGSRAVVLGLAAVLAVKIAHRPARTTESSVCETTPEAELATAWSPALRAQLVQRFGPSFDYPAGEIDGFAARWLDGYRRACASPRTTQTFAKLGCLLGERDEVAGLAELIPAIPAAVIPEIEMGGVLPRTQACDGDAPVTPPTLPDDAGKRAQIRALRPRILVARFGPPAEVLAAMPGVLAEAQAIAWDPILAEAHQGFAIAARRSVQWELARDHYKAANRLARSSHHYHLEAETWLGLLMCEMEAASDLTDGTAFLDLVAQARVATHNAGNDPGYLARLSQLEGSFAAARGQLDEAIARYDQARAIESTVHNPAAAMRFAIAAADARVRRDRPGDLAAAWALLVDAQAAVAAARLVEPMQQEMASVLSFVAELRGDLSTAHAWADRGPPPKPPAAAVAIAGRVVDSDGNGVGGATVVAWRGVLEADPARVYARSSFEGDIATTATDGTFTVRAAADGGIIAERGERRSRPRVIGGGAITLALEATRTIAGSVASEDEVLSGIAIIAHYQLARDLAWNCASPVGRLHDYRLAGLPGGDATLRLDARLDPNHPMRKLELGPARTGAAPRWPVGPSIDAIVRNSPNRTHSIYVLRGRRTARTRGELDQLVETANDARSHFALVIGIGDQTVDGMKHYARGDGHAVFLGNAPGEVTVCAAAAAPTSPATCKTIEIPRTTAEIRDGRGVYPAIAVVLDPGTPNQR